jgi:hypothetical protein
MDSVLRPAARWRAAFLGCAALLCAGWAGAWWDEYSRAGWSTWMSICSVGKPGFLTVLQLYAALLPTSLVAMLVAGLGLLGAAALRREDPQLALGGLASHGACLVAMPLAIYACAQGVNASAGADAQLLTMLALDLGLALLFVPVLMWLLQSVGPSALPPCCVPTPRSSA